MTIGIVRPRAGAGAGPAQRDRRASPRCRGSLVAVDLAVVAVLDRVAGRLAGASGRSCVLVLLLTVVLYGPLRLRLSARRAPAGARRAGPRPTTSSPAWPRPWSTPTRGPSSSRRSPTRSPRRSGSATSGSRWTGPAGSGSSPRTASRPAEVRTLPITYRDQEVGRVVLPARGLRSRLSAPRRAAARATWSGRPPRRPGPASSPTSCRTAASGWWSPARRSAAGSGATCTTGSGPSLSGVVYQLESARLLVDKDPARPRSAPSRG